MSNLTQRMQAHRFKMLAISMLLLGVLAGIGLGLSRNHTRPVQTLEPKITSKASALRIVGITRTSLGNHSVLVVKLQNISDKDIKAYTVASGKAWVTKHYFFEEQSIAPNAIENQLIPLSSDASQDPKLTFENGKELTIAAAFFADGTGQGDPVFVARFTDQHAGMRDQANRILPCLQGLSSSLVAQGESAVATCEAEALRLPTRSNGRSVDYEKGLETTRAVVLSQLKDLKDGMRSNNLSEVLNKEDKVTKVFQALAQSPR